MNRWSAIGLALLVAGCDRGTSSGSPGVGKKTVVSNGGSYAVIFETQPAPIPLNAPFALRFSVEPKAAGSTSAPIDVEVDARMPAHFHGMNRVPKLVRHPDGSFEAEGLLFHMPGQWELYFDITRAGRTERAQVDVNLK